MLESNEKMKRPAEREQGIKNQISRVLVGQVVI